MGLSCHLCPTAHSGVFCPVLARQRPPYAHTRMLDFPHDHARSRAYRWGEDGIAGVCDTHGLQNIAFAFWNGKE